MIRDINLDLEGETSLEVQTENNKLYEKTAEMIKTWADGKNRPMNGSYILLKSVKNMLIPEYL